MAERGFYVRPARTPTDLQDVVIMFKAYAEALGIDLTFQDFSTEVDGMPGKYSPPTGEVLLARQNDTHKVVGVAGVRPLQAPDICEMKRLYVSPLGRGLGVGTALVEAVIKVARERGYTEMRLDTLPSMKPAQRLYKQFGFVETSKYYDMPIEGTMFMALKL